MRLGNYQLGEKLGEGGMGAVFVAHDPMGRRVAIKRLPVDAALRPEELERFRREGEAVAALGSHANIVQVHALEQEGGTPYLVMELVVGESLASRIKRGPLPQEEALPIAQALAKAVGHAHAKGILHRDLKPANVLIRAEDKTPMLTDFGLAKDLAETRERLTRTGQTLGTPSYMAPEQAAGEPERFGPPTDVYGLGATLYAMLAGRPPFKGTSVVNTLNAVLTRDPEPPSAVEPTVPKALDRICLKALAKEPEDRYPTVAALAEDLARFERGERVEARAPRRSPSPLHLVAGAAPVLLLAALTFALLPSTPTAPQPTERESTAPVSSALPLAQRGTPRPQRSQRKLHLEHPGCEGAVFLDAKRLVTAGVGGVWLWDLDQDPPTPRPLEPGSARALSVAVWRDEAGQPRLVIAGTDDGYVRTYDPHEAFARPPQSLLVKRPNQRPRHSRCRLAVAQRKGWLIASFVNFVYKIDLRALTAKRWNELPRAGFNGSVASLGLSAAEDRLLVGYDAAKGLSPGIALIDPEALSPAGEPATPLGGVPLLELRSALPSGPGWIVGLQDGSVRSLTRRRLTEQRPADATQDPPPDAVVRPQPERPADVAHTTAVIGLARLHDGRLATLCGKPPGRGSQRKGSNQLAVWSPSGALESVLDPLRPNPTDHYSLALSPSGDRLAAALQTAADWQGAVCFPTPPPSPASRPAERGRPLGTEQECPVGPLWIRATLEHEDCTDAVMLDEHHVLTAAESSKQSLRCWDLRDPAQPRWTLDVPNGVRFLSWRPAEGLLLVGQSGWQNPDGKVFAYSLPGHQEAFPPLALRADDSPTGSACAQAFAQHPTQPVVAVADLRAVHWLDLRSGERTARHVLPAPPEAPSLEITALSFDGTGEALLAAWKNRQRSGDGQGVKSNGFAAFRGERLAGLEPSTEGHINSVVAAGPGTWWTGDQSRHVLLRTLSEAPLRLERTGFLEATELLKDVRHFSHVAPVACLTRLRDGRLLSAGSSNASEAYLAFDDLALWNTQEGQLQERIQLPDTRYQNEKDQPTSKRKYGRLHSSPSGRWAAVTVYELGVEVWAIPEASE